MDKENGESGEPEEAGVDVLTVEPAVEPIRSRVQLNGLEAEYVQSLAIRAGVRLLRSGNDNESRELTRFFIELAQGRICIPERFVAQYRQAVEAIEAMDQEVGDGAL